MVNKTLLRTLVFVGILTVAFCSALPAFAQEHGAAGADRASTSIGEGLRVAGLALGAAVALAGAALGTGRAQSAIGAGGTGAIAEKPELFTNIVILVAIPETIVIFGFVMAFFLFGSI